jgi:hypothetical protein
MIDEAEPAWTARKPPRLDERGDSERVATMKNTYITGPVFRFTAGHRDAG